MILDPALQDRNPAPFRVVWGAAGTARVKGRVFFEADCDDDEQAQFLALFALLEEQADGRLSNPTSFKYPLKSRGNLGEFKIHGKRLFFFRHQNDFIVVSGYTKRKNDTDKTELERAERIREDMLSEMKKG